MNTVWCVVIIMNKLEQSIHQLSAAIQLKPIDCIKLFSEGSYLPTRKTIQDFDFGFQILSLTISDEMILALIDSLSFKSHILNLNNNDNMGRLSLKLIKLSKWLKNNVFVRRTYSTCSVLYNFIGKVEIYSKFFT